MVAREQVMKQSFDGINIKGFQVEGDFPWNWCIVHDKMTCTYFACTLQDACCYIVDNMDNWIDLYFGNAPGGKSGKSVRLIMEYTGRDHSQQPRLLWTEICPMYNGYQCAFVTQSNVTQRITFMLCNLRRFA